MICKTFEVSKASLSYEMFSLDRGNTSFGSVEGVGGWPGCDSREVELENRYSWVFPVVLRYVASANILDNMFVQLQLSALFLSSVLRYRTLFNLIKIFVLRYALFLQKRQI